MRLYVCLCMSSACLCQSHPKNLLGGFPLLLGFNCILFGTKAKESRPRMRMLVCT